MKVKIDIYSLLVGVLLGAATVFTVAASTAKQTSWDYTVCYQDSTAPNLEQMRKLGSEGWELVCSYNGPEGKYPGFLLKRAR